MTRRIQSTESDSASGILAASFTHLFRSPTSAIAYCGYVPPRRTEHIALGEAGRQAAPPDNLCPDCAGVYARTVTPPSTYRTLGD